MKEILHYLKTHGERLDTEIALATGIPLAEVRLYLPELAAKGEVMAQPYDQIREGQKSRGNKLPISWIYSPSIAGQKIKGAIEAIVVHCTG